MVYQETPSDYAQFPITGHDSPVTNTSVFTFKTKLLLASNIEPLQLK